MRSFNSARRAGKCPESIGTHFRPTEYLTDPGGRPASTKRNFAGRATSRLAMSKSMPEPAVANEDGVAHILERVHSCLNAELEWLGSGSFDACQAGNNRSMASALEFPSHPRPRRWSDQRGMNENECDGSNHAQTLQSAAPHEQPSAVSVVHTACKGRRRRQAAQPNSAKQLIPPARTAVRSGETARGS